MTAPGEPKIDAPPTPSGWTLSVDGGEPVAVRDVSISVSENIDVSSFGSMYSMHMPTHETIVVELDKLPCSSTSHGVHELEFRHKEAVQKHRAQLFECEIYSSIPGISGIDSVRMVWHTVHTVSLGYGDVPYEKGVAYVPYPKNPTGYADSGWRLSEALPALAQEVKVPCDHYGVKVDLQNIIIHLNDSHEWTREQIADWLDTLDLDLAFPVPEVIPANVR